MKLKQMQRQLLLAVSFAGLVACPSTGFADIPSPNWDSNNASAAQLVARAQKALKDGNVPLAVINFKNASSAAPRNGSIRAQLGSVLLESGDYYSAERELRQARKDGGSDRAVLPFLFQAMLYRHEEKALLNEFPDPASNVDPAIAADIFKAHALAFQNLGQSNDAVVAMDKSLKLRRDEAGLLTRARLAQQQRDIPAAMSYTDEAGKLAPADVAPMLFKFGLQMETNDFNGALKQSNDVIAKFPTSLPARFSHVEVMMRTNQDAKAGAELNAILAKNPNIAIGIYYRAMLTAKAGDAKGAWRNAQTLPATFLQSQAGIALAVSQMADNAGAAETAAAILNGAIAKFPSDPSLRLRAAAIRLRQNDTDGALSALEPIRDNLDPATTQMLARIYLKAGKRDDALAALQKLDQAGKGSDSVTLGIVDIENRQGSSDEATKSLAQAVAHKPTDPILVGQLVVALSRSGRFSDALMAADKLGNDPKQRVQSLALRAQVLLAQQNYDAALAAYDKAVQLEPTNPVSLYGRADVLEAMGKYANATKDLNVILVNNPKNVSVYLKLAEIAAHQGQDQNVKSILASASQQAPADPSPRISLVRYLLVRKDFKGAIGTANDLAKMQPNNVQVMALLGQAQSAAGQKAAAVATFRRVVSMAPKGPAPLILLANALQVSGDRNGALSTMKSAIALDKNSAETRIAMVNLQFAQSDGTGAVDTARAFRAANPTSIADMILGDTLLKAGHRDEAAAVFQQSYASRPNSTALMRNVGIYVSGGNPQSALDAMSNWLAKNPADSAVRVEYATLLMQLNDKPKAATQYQSVLQRMPNNVLSLNNLGWLKQKDDPRLALSLVSQAAKLAPDNASVLDTLGWIKLQQKQTADSLPILQRAHDLRPADGTTSYHLALALNATGNHDAAKGLLKPLLASGTKFDDRDAATQLMASIH